MGDEKKRRLVIQVLALAESLAGDYMKDFDLLDEYSLDKQVSDCKMQMYFYMMTGKSEDYDAFLDLYNQLDDERKAAIEDDYKNIMKARANQGFDEQNTKEEKGIQKTIGRKEDIYE